VPNTLVCFSSDLSQCVGGDAAVTSIIPTGTLSSTDVSITISFPSTSGTHTVTMIGTGPAPTTGTYTDTLGDTGTWSASAVSSLGVTFLGTFNSTSHPLTIPPSISLLLTQIANRYGVSESLCEWRMRMTGVDVQIRRAYR
jgi:hypothetical protein